MSPQIKNLIQRGLAGLVLGIAFYLIVSSIAKLFLDWFIPLANQRFPFEKPIWASAIYAVAITLAWGIRTPFRFISLNYGLLLTSAVSGVIGMASFLITGMKRGLSAFLVLFTLLVLVISFLGLAMMITG
jgi:hypothetical protein